MLVEGGQKELPAVQEKVMSHGRELIHGVVGLEDTITRSPLVLGILGDSLEFQVERRAKW